MLLGQTQTLCMEYGIPRTTRCHHQKCMYLYVCVCITYVSVCMCMSVDTSVSDSISVWARLSLNGSLDHGLCGVKFRNLSTRRRNRHLSIGRSLRCCRTTRWGQVSPVMRKDITVLGDSLKCNKCNKCSYHISAQQKKN